MCRPPTRIAGALILLTPAMCCAQQRPEPPVRPMTQPPIAKPAEDTSKLQGARLLKYIQGQLALSPEQTTRYNELVEQYKQKRKELATSGGSEEFARWQAELTEALRSRDANRIAAARDALDKASPERALMQEFYAGLDKLLSDKQKRMLAAVQAGLKEGRTVDLRLKPREAARIAESLSLTPEQAGRLATLQDDFRARIAVQSADDEAREALVTAFVNDVRGLLSPDQAKEFDRRTEQLWIEAASAASTRPAG